MSKLRCTFPEFSLPTPTKSLYRNFLSALINRSIAGAHLGYWFVDCFHFTAIIIAGSAASPANGCVFVSPRSVAGCICVCMCHYAQFRDLQILHRCCCNFHNSIHNSIGKQWTVFFLLQYLRSSFCRCTLPRTLSFLPVHSLIWLEWEGSV